jgi:hypothetical protein
VKGDLDALACLLLQSGEHLLARLPEDLDPDRRVERVGIVLRAFGFAGLDLFLSLVRLRDRIEAFGGSFEVNWKPGEGTSVATDARLIGRPCVAAPGHDVWGT